MTVAIQQTDNGLGIVFENGKIKQESLEESYIKHNLLCFARIPKHITSDPLLRKGCSMSLIEEVFSTSWQFYEQATTNLNTEALKIELNKSLARDFVNGKIKRVIVNKVSLANSGNSSSINIHYTIDQNSKNLSIAI